eukprot:351737-Chlamydomonas_euryale.AAC.10
MKRSCECTGKRGGGCSGVAHGMRRRCPCAAAKVGGLAHAPDLAHGLEGSTHACGLSFSPSVSPMVTAAAAPKVSPMVAPLWAG